MSLHGCGRIHSSNNPKEAKHFSSHTSVGLHILTPVSSKSPATSLILQYLDNIWAEMESKWEDPVGPTSQRRQAGGRGVFNHAHLNPPNARTIGLGGYDD